eukprot:8747694-Ditylum_brightwellii.AAC.1
MNYSTNEDPGVDLLQTCSSDDINEGMVFEEMQRNDDESHNEAIYNNEDEFDGNLKEPYDVNDTQNLG